jgi:serine/threonine protein phosphatase PrpC
VTTPVEIVARSECGRVRFNNEDRVDYDAALGVAVLADGMGGQNAGETASEVAVAAVMRALRLAPAPRRDALEDAVAYANRAVYRLGRDRPELAGMGTTLVAAAVDEQGMSVAHVGDSRAYRFGRPGLERLTVDHSVVQQLIDTGVLTPAAARRAPNRHIVTRALGMVEGIACDVVHVTPASGDVFLLVSDGLTDMLEDASIEAICRGHQRLPELVDALIAAALEAGGLDNVSVVALRLRAATFGGDNLAPGLRR